MDSSSDGSFAWTDASNDTIDSGAMANDNIIKIHSEDESISGKSYKKKLQTELFAQGNGTVKNEASEQLSNEQKQKQSDSQHVTPKKNKIKREAHSDIEISASNYKANGHDHTMLSDDSYGESYLDLKVKAEQELADPPQKKTKKRRNKSILCSSDILHDDDDESCHTEKTINRNYKNKLNQEETDIYEKKTKKKKKKTKNRKESSMSDASNHHNGDAAVSEQDGDRSPTQYAHAQDNTTHIDSVASTSKATDETISFEDSHTFSYEQTLEAKQQLDLPANKSVSFNVLDTSHTRTPRLSERIQFEEDESSEMETSQLQSNKTSTKSSKLKTFLKNNLNVKPFHGQLKPESMLTVHDEIWMVRCPKDVDIDAFLNKHLILEGRCKLKLNGQTYEGTVDNDSENMSLFLSDQSSFIIKSLSVKGFLNLHRRIPKCHMRDELMVANPSNFIPLPETKCRHPLFGANYRKAIKLPAGVAERLRSHPAAAAAQAHHSGTRSCLKPELEMDQRENCKKKKKRKHCDSEEVTPKKRKRIKHDLESAEAWESEQAIEENLFNF